MRCLEDRFKDKCIPEPNTGCLLWIGALTRGNYGHIRYNRDGKWVMRRAHLVSYELYVGDIPEGMQILHICDQPLCVNPSHLFIGSNQDNVDDKINKGRHNWGRDSRNTHLSMEIAREVREFYSNNNISYSKLGKMFNTSAPQISRILNNQIWRESAKEG